MKVISFTFAIAVISLGVGFLIGQRQPMHFIDKEINTSELVILNELRKNCRTADKKGEIYFSRYGQDKKGSEPINSPEWVDAQSWEQACSDAFQALRIQFREER